MQTTPLHEQFKDIPILNESPVVMEHPNQKIMIHQGEFSLSRNGVTCYLEGEIYFNWYPNMCVKFTGKVTSSVREIEWLKEYELIVNGKSNGAVVVTDVSDVDTPYCEGEGRKFIWGDKTMPVNEVAFAIPNMREFIGRGAKIVTQTGIILKYGRLILDDKPYKIEIDSDLKSKEKISALEKNGGYLNTYAGKITKKGGAISLSELHNWHDRFHHFLYFLNGRRVAPMFYTGMQEGKKTWTDYGNYSVDVYKNVGCWSDIMPLDNLSQLWKSYNKLWKSNSDKDFLKTAIHWYVEANSQAGAVEGSIILIQTALELIYNRLIVEKQKLITGNDADGLSAANKIRLIIFHLKISATIPPSMKELASLLNIKDGPEALVKIRNALVHGQEAKRAELMKISLKAKYEALQLGIWYVELALLYIMGYHGKYKNRTDGNMWRDTGVLVPWVNEKTFKLGPPSSFAEEEINAFVDLLDKQGKVRDPTVQKIRNCKYIAMGFSWGHPVAIGAIKPKTVNVFEPQRANLKQREKDFDWEIGYFYTEPEFEQRKFASTIINMLLNNFGPGNLMATTEIREGNQMVHTLEKRGFKQAGNSWKSSISGNDLRLFLRETAVHLQPPQT